MKNIYFEKANASHIDTIFAWLAVPEVQEFWQQFPLPRKSFATTVLQLFSFVNYFVILVADLTRMPGFRANVANKEVFVGGWTVEYSSRRV